MNTTTNHSLTNANRKTKIINRKSEKKMKLTLFQNFNEVINTVPVEQIVTEIKDGTYKSQILYLHPNMNLNSISMSFRNPFRNFIQSMSIKCIII